MRPADGVGVESEDDRVYAAILPDGPVVVLEGVAALIWYAACSGDTADVAAVVAATTGEDAADVAVHVDAFIAELVRRGLLVAG